MDAKNLLTWISSPTNDDFLGTSKCGTCAVRPPASPTGRKRAIDVVDAGEEEEEEEKEGEEEEGETTNAIRRRKRMMEEELADGKTSTLTRCCAKWNKRRNSVKATIMIDDTIRTRMGMRKEEEKEERITSLAQIKAVDEIIATKTAGENINGGGFYITTKGKWLI